MNAKLSLLLSMLQQVHENELSALDRSNLYELNEQLFFVLAATESELVIRCRELHSSDTRH